MELSTVPLRNQAAFGPSSGWTTTDEMLVPGISARSGSAMASSRSGRVMPLVPSLAMARRRSTASHVGPRDMNSTSPSRYPRNRLAGTAWQREVDTIGTDDGRDRRPPLSCRPQEAAHDGSHREDHTP